MKQRDAGNSYIGYGIAGEGAVSNSSRSGKTQGIWSQESDMKFIGVRMSWQDMLEVARFWG